MPFELIPYKSAADWQRALIKRLVARVREDLAADRPAVLCLAGGSTPLAVYAELAAADLDWSRVTVLPGDDRCVPHTDSHSNVYQFREAFAKAAGITVLPITEADGSNGLQAALDATNANPMHFSATVLGMGNDMHTASLFPGAINLAAGIDKLSHTDVLQTVPDPLPPEAPYPRITLTAQRLLRSRAVILAIRGQAKRDALRRAMDLGDPLQAPILALINDSATNTEIHWAP